MNLYAKGERKVKNTRYITRFVSLLVLLISITWTQDARADESNRKTVFTINQPVRVPGNLILPAGKYVMKLADTQTRNVVTIMDAKETKVYTTFFAFPEELQRPTEQVQLILAESAKGSPEQLRAWYYPGLTTGLEFPAISRRPSNQAANSN
jgi:hypothetical protein